MYDEEISELCKKDVWCRNFYGRYSDKRVENIKLKDLYEEFSKRGIKIKYNVYEKKRFKKNIDIGDPTVYPGKDEVKTKKLILYKSAIRPM